MDRPEKCDADRVLGFGEPVPDPAAWLEQTAIELPGAIDDAAAAVLPPVAAGVAEPVPAIRITHWAVGLGRLEPRLAEIADALAEGGTLVGSLAHSMGPSRARLALDGQLSRSDPNRALPDEEAAFDAPRLCRALSAAGFVVADLQRAFMWDGKLPEKSVTALLKCGISATRYIYETPPERLFVRAVRGAPISGSALIANTGDPLAAAATQAAVRALLPEGWEVVVGAPSEREADSWNEAVTRSRGDHLWLLRAGDTPSRAVFDALRGPSITRPVMVAPGPDGRALTGLMLERAVLMDVGPLVSDIECDAVAAEEWVMRASAAGHRVDEVEAESGWQAHAPHPVDETLAREMLERWEPAGDLDNPGDVEARPAPVPPWVREEREPKITLCMITRDEERFLGDCLARVEPAVDEIVIVDTGSTDSTVAIAESHGANVLQEPWQDDFSAPRNRGLAEATGDWILVLDADELVAEDSVPLIRECAQNDRACGFQIRFVNEYEQETSRGVTMVRMFRNLPGISYRYAIHEQVVPSLVAEAEPMNLGIHPSDLEVIHYGYSEAVMDERGKRDRNLKLFRKQLADTPDDIYTIYKYGDFLRMTNWPRAEVIAAFQRALDLIVQQPIGKLREMPFAGEVAGLLGLELVRDRRIEEADRVTRLGLARAIPTPNLLYIAASVATALGRFDEALAHWHRLVRYETRVLVVPVQRGITGWVAWTGMAVCWAAKGDVARAEELLHQAIAEEPEWEVSWLQLSALHLGQGKPELAIETLVRFLTEVGESTAVRAQGAAILSALGLAARAREFREGTLGKTSGLRVAGDPVIFPGQGQKEQEAVGTRVQGPEGV